MFSFLISSLVHAQSNNGNVAVNFPPLDMSPKWQSFINIRSLKEENTLKTSRNFFDLEPNCEQLGARYCDHVYHNFGSGKEFASWLERTQFVYTNMARMDASKFAQAPYDAVYACATKSGLTPFFWSSELTQASRFHSNEMATLNHWGHLTALENADLFGNSTSTGDRIAYFMTTKVRDWDENIAAGRSEPLSVTTKWLKSPDYCPHFFGTSSFLGVGHFYESSATYRHYWTQNFGTDTVLPKQDIVAGTHDTTSNTNRFLVQVHMAQAPKTVLLVIGGIRKPMSLLLGTAKTGTYFVDVATLPRGDSDGCVPYHFDVNGVSRMPADKSYYFLTYGLKTCKRNIGQGGYQCSCPNGTPKSGTACAVNGAAMCAYCNFGFHTNDQETACVPNICNCENGTPRNGTTCLVNGAAMCARCNAGFTINPQQTRCSQNVCTCPNGTPRIGTACRVTRAAMCVRCNAGFSLNDRQSRCIPNVCTCPNGTPKSGTACAVNGAAMCANCNSGFTINDQETACFLNVCTCRNGTPASGTRCARNGATGCASCHGGYLLHDKQCRLAPCDVPNSNQERGPSCRCLQGFSGTIMWSGHAVSGTCTLVEPSEPDTDNADTNPIAIITPKAITVPGVPVATAPKAITTVADVVIITEDTGDTPNEAPGAVFNVQNSKKEASGSAIPQMGLMIGLCFIFHTILQ